MPKGIPKSGINKGWFKKGYKPWSKNKKGWTHKGSFKKGHPVIDGFQKGKKHPNWKGGRYKSSFGYIWIYKPEHPFCNNYRYIFEHRLVVEQQIGRYLKPEERVHHHNEIRDDNRPENLMAFVNESVHQCFHKNPSNVKPSEIVFDGCTVRGRI